MFVTNDDDDDDDDDDDKELLLQNGLPTKGVYPYIQPEPVAEILTTANLQHVAYAELEF